MPANPPTRSAEKRREASDASFEGGEGVSGVRDGLPIRLKVGRRVREIELAAGQTLQIIVIREEQDLIAHLERVLSADLAEVVAQRFALPDLPRRALHALSPGAIWT